jgi:hypothetical protein
MTPNWARARPATRGLGSAVRRGRTAFFWRRDGMAQFAPADRGPTEREGRPRQLLDLHLHQLVTPDLTPPCDEQGRPIEGSFTCR